MIEPKQVQLIHIQKAQLGLSRDEYEAAIGAQTNGKKTSSKQLTYFEADNLIDYFARQGAKIKSTRYRRTLGNRGNVIFLPSSEQLEMIESLKARVAWRVEDGYQRWLSKYMRIDRVKTAAQASRVIEGLKGMVKHGTGETGWQPRTTSATGSATSPPA